jgi:hypothetical protein
MKKLLVITMLAAGCAEPEVPDNPTYTEHIKPILDGNCIRCHGSPPIGGAPDYLRLDVWEVEGGLVDGVGESEATGNAAYLISAYTFDGTMPPNYTLEAWQIETLQRWCDNQTCVPAQ